MPVLSAIAIYPLKSAAGISMNEVDLERRGLAGDRRWMLVDAAGRFLSQRTHPRLALMRVGRDPGGLHLTVADRAPLWVRVPGPDAERQRLERWRRGDSCGGRSSRVVFSSSGRGRAARLHAGHEPPTRRSDCATDRAVVSLADGFPLLLTNEASLDALNDRLDVPLPMNRFRPNLVVAGADAWAEDAWRRIRIGDVIVRAVKPCGRCVVTTTDQETATRGKEPLSALASFRRLPGAAGACFGWNLIPESTGPVRLGDRVELLEAGQPPAFQGC